MSFNKPSELTPEGERFYKRYHNLVNDIIKALATMTAEHDVYGFGMFVDCIYTAATRAKAHMEETEASFDGAIDC